MPDKRHIKLICGNPDPDDPEAKYKGCSFSRFVFPFGYKAEKKDVNINNNVSYEEIKHEEGLSNDLFIQRIKYFTSETGSVIYDNALWVEIPVNQWDKSAWSKGISFMNCNNVGKKAFCVRMSRPRLVLFDWKERKNSSRNNIGFLILDLWFPEGQEVILDDLLCLNEYFRCFDYPGFTEHWTKYRQAMENVPLEYFPEDPDKFPRVKDVEDGDKHQAYLQRWTKLLEIPVKVGNETPYRLVPEDFSHEALKWIKGPSGYVQEEMKGKRGNSPNNHLIYNDFRAYVWCAAVLKEGGMGLQKFSYTSQHRPFEFGHWVKLLNVDSPNENGPSETARAISEFEKKWARERTYRRWEDCGNWYGFNYHAGVAVLKPSVFVTHFMTIYFDMILLLFYLRIRLFGFSNELSSLCRKIERLEDARKEFKDLRNHFSRFTILYQFPLLSNQQQAIEMYEIAREHFDVDTFFQEIKSEIDNTHEYLESVEANNLSRMANLIGRVGIPLMVASLLAGLLGMNNFHIWENISKGYFFNIDPEFWTACCIIILLTPLFSWMLIKKYLKAPDKQGDGNG